MHSTVKQGMERVESVQRLVHGMLSLADCLHSTWHKPLLQLRRSPAPAGGGQGSNATVAVGSRASCVQTQEVLFGHPGCFYPGRHSLSLPGESQ